MNFGMVMRNLNIKKIKNYVTWIKAKSYLDTSFIVYIKADDVQKDIAENVAKRFDISNYELDKPLLKRSNKKSYCLNEG